MPVATATVVTVVAEVRVLMVGSRQITRSVFRQLDVIPINEVQPMGRVNERCWPDQYHEFWVVGRHQTTGELVRGELVRSLQVELAKINGTPYRPPSEHDAMQSVKYREWKVEYDELPLIVLAGLK